MITLTLANKNTGSVDATKELSCSLGSTNTIVSALRDYIMLLSLLKLLMQDVDAP